MDDFNEAKTKKENRIYGKTSVRGVERDERINHYARLLLFPLLFPFPSLAEKAPGKKCSKIRRVVRKVAVGWPVAFPTP